GPEPDLGGARGTESPSGEAGRGAVEHGPVVVAEEQEEPGRREAPDPGDAGEARGELGCRPALEGVEVEARGRGRASQGGHPPRAMAETGALAERPDVRAGERARPGEGAQPGRRRAGAAERRDAGRHPGGACPRRAGARDRHHEVLEQRGPAKEPPQPTRGHVAEQRVATAEAVEGPEAEVERERAPDPRGQRRQDLDLARVLAGDAQHDATRGGTDGEEEHRPAGQLLGPLENRTGAVAPAKRRQLVTGVRDHGCPQVEPTSRLQDDPGTLERHGGPMVPVERVAPPVARAALTSLEARGHTADLASCDPPSSSTARPWPAMAIDWHVS